MNKNLDRGFKDLSIFEIGPVFTGSNPGEQNTVVCGLSAGKKSRLSWIEKERNVDLFDVKRDVVQTLVEAGYNADKFFIDSEAPNYYHPGKSGRLFLNRGKDQVAAYFGEIHPNILKKIDIKTESLVGFEIFLDNLKSDATVIDMSSVKPTTAIKHGNNLNSKNNIYLATVSRVEPSLQAAFINFGSCLLYTSDAADE